MVEVDTSDSNLVWGRFLPVRVLIKVTKPLKRGATLVVSGGKNVLVFFKYEHLPDLCYLCGWLDHYFMECDEAAQMKKVLRVVQHEYGPWMNAEFREGLLGYDYCERLYASLHQCSTPQEHGPPPLVEPICKGKEVLSHVESSLEAVTSDVEFGRN
ncbi:hypothetical protein REPUB_Repub16aG0044300 [Reevesia pubescens]